MMILTKGGEIQLLRKKRHNSIYYLCKTLGIVPRIIIFKKVSTSELTVRRKLTEFEKETKLTYTNGESPSNGNVEQVKRSLKQLGGASKTPIFNLLNQKSNFDYHLIDFTYQINVGAFIGSATDEMIEKIGISKAFVEWKGIKDNYFSAFSDEEGKVQQVALT